MVFKVARRTVKEEVADFLSKIAAQSPVPSTNITVLLDNHSAHHSGFVKDFCTFIGMKLLFMPAYSSPYNPMEFVWGTVKRRFQKQLAKTHGMYDHANFQTDLLLTCEEVGAQLTSTIMYASEKYYRRSLDGFLV